MSIEIKSLSKSFEDKLVLRDVSLTVDSGQVLFVIGASGTGKSVLMRHVIGLEKPDRGEVRVDGIRVDTLPERKLAEVRKRCGFVFQHPALLDFENIERNVAIPLQRRRRLSSKEALASARRWLREVGIEEEEATKMPSQVGAGIRKRASIARVLALEPAYVIYDEPTTGLDPINARRVDALIRRLADDLKVTTVVVSHDLKSIFGVADRVAFLYRTRLRAEGRPAELARSTDPVLRQFLSGSAEGPMGNELSGEGEARAEGLVV
ncbi:MAG: ABC transporter ATP-binding protein [Myxococcota bacterium]